MSLQTIQSNFLAMETAPARTELQTWVKQMATFCEAKKIHWCNGSEDEDWKGLDFTREDFAEIMSVDRELSKKELLSHEELFERIYDKLPKEFFFMRELLLSSLWRSPEQWGLQPEDNE